MLHLATFLCLLTLSVASASPFGQIAKAMFKNERGGLRHHHKQGGHNKLESNVWRCHINDVKDDEIQNGPFWIKKRNADHGNDMKSNNFRGGISNSFMCKILMGDKESLRIVEEMKRIIKELKEMKKNYLEKMLAVKPL